MVDLIQKFEAAAAQILPPRKPLLAAVSGGVDSMVMLDLLHRLAGRFRWNITVAHFNHRLRGRSSDADQRLVQRAARERGLMAIVASEDVRRLAETSGQSIEMAARRARHGFLARVARENGIGTIALAHHADDQVELFFVRLFRGAGAEGLAGMAADSPAPADLRLNLARPMLKITREEIREYASNRRIPFREDASNECLDHLRNRIRHELLPFLEAEFQPALRDVVLRAMELLAGEADYSALSALHWAQTGQPTFDEVHPAVQRRLLQFELIREGVLPDFHIVESLRLAPDRLVQVSHGKAVWRDAGGCVHLEETQRHEFDTSQTSVHLAARPARVDFGGARVSWTIRRCATAPSPARKSNVEEFDADAVGPRITLRHWLPGDRFQPIGMDSAVKLQDLFANAKVPKSDRHQRLIAVADSGEIFWVEGLRVGEKFKLVPGTRRVLVWRWRRNA